MITQSFSQIVEFGSFLFLGIVGAIFANATGAGGGVVFVPFFNQLSLSNETAVATSLAIQCFGMTAGAITWVNYYRALQDRQHVGYQFAKQWEPLRKGLLLCVPFSLLGIYVAQFLLNDYTGEIQSGLPFYFGLFSIALAIFIYASIPLMRRQKNNSVMLTIDLISLAVISLLGGLVTAWISVGVGELVAVYLILRGFNISFAIALAVIITAFSVQGAIVYHIVFTEVSAIYWQIVMFAGAGAIIGGVFAKHVVLFFSPVKLKFFFATWVLLMGIIGLPW